MGRSCNDSKARILAGGWPLSSQSQLFEFQIVDRKSVGIRGVEGEDDLIHRDAQAVGSHPQRRRSVGLRARTPRGEKHEHPSKYNPSHFPSI
jgi:hypothetical protein